MLLKQVHRIGAYFSLKMGIGTIISTFPSGASEFIPLLYLRVPFVSDAETPHGVTRLHFDRTSSSHSCSPRRDFEISNQTHDM